MKSIKLVLSSAILIGTTAISASAFDRITTNALKACHDYIWSDIPEFNSLPNAAISVFPGLLDDTSVTVFWNVMWDEPTVRSAGNCVYAGDKIIGFEDYTKME
jgi:hypothetical protein